MLTGICIPGVAHEPIDPKVFDLMERKRIQVARVEVTPGVSTQAIANVVDQFALRPEIWPLFLIGAGEWGTNNYADPTAPNGSRRYEPHENASCAVQILYRVRDLKVVGFEERCLFSALNEVDLGTMDYKARPLDCAEAGRQLYTALRDRDFRGPILSPSVSNLNDRGFKMLRGMDWSRLPRDLVCDVHWYPDSKGYATSGHDGRTVEEEWRELVTIVGKDRVIAVTEFGFATMGTQGEPHQAAETKERLAFFAQKACLLACAYQINDGPNRKDFYDNLGVWTYPDRRPKLVADVFAEFAA